MIYERLRLMQDLLADDGSIFVHCDWRKSGHLRSAMDDLFGAANFRNEIYWYYYNKMPDTRKGVFPRSTDTVLWYVKNRDSAYTFLPLTEKRDKPTKQLVRQKVGGRMVNARDETGSVLYQNREDRVIDNVWRLSMLQPADKTENLYYATQKPEHLIHRVIEACSSKDDLVADFFCGSGTTLAVAEKLGRKWIGCDLGRFAVHTSRKRLIGVQREARKAGKPYRSFEILNLGKYERQYFIEIDPNQPEAARREESIRREEHYLGLILSAYKAERKWQNPPFHGSKGRTWVVVGPVDAPVTQRQFVDVVAECRQQKITAVDILGFEFEMGLAPNFTDEARRQGVNVALRYIPKDVFDKRAVAAGQVQFYDLAYVEVKTQVQGLSVRVTLADFSVYYRQDDEDALGAKLKPGGSKVTVANGQVLKISKDKAGIITTAVLTKTWTDWVDYWAIDFQFGTNAERLTEVVNGFEIQTTTGNFIFENEWQSFRTRKDRKIELTSAGHTYAKKGKYKIAVKVIDIFGNDTTKVVVVTV